MKRRSAWISWLVLTTCAWACGRHDTPVAAQLEMQQSTGGLLGEREDAGLGTDPQCVVEKQEAQLPTVYLLLLLDQSGSMGDGEYGERALKWDPITGALRAFLADPESRGLQASLTLFPPDINQAALAADPSRSDERLCQVESYETPRVPMVKLPQASVFGDAMDAVAPPNEWGTPTELVLRGAITQTEGLLAETPDAKISIVLLTDGEPSQCEQNNSLIGTVEVAQSVRDRIPTYVVGAGDLLDNLSQIAMAGGTGGAFIVPVNNPSETRQALLDTFSEIRGELLPCETRIPEPPMGRIFEKEKVAVEYSIDDAPLEQVDYSEDCATGIGWRYDSVETPTEIQLCPSTCETLQLASNAKLSVTFACKVLIPTIK